MDTLYKAVPESGKTGSFLRCDLRDLLLGRERKGAEIIHLIQGDYLCGFNEQSGQSFRVFW